MPIAGSRRLEACVGGQARIPLVAFGIMKAAFYCEASASIGGGHVMRCLALAGELARRGAEVVFLVGAAAEATVPDLARARFATYRIAADMATAMAALAGHWRAGADWLVVDSYTIGRGEEHALRRAAMSLLAIDDLANRVHDCDLLLDQSMGRQAADYAGLVPPACRLLIGPRHALLRPAFAAARASALARREQAFAQGLPARRVLVSMGMTDVGAVTGHVVDALLAGGDWTAIDAVVGAATPSLPDLRARAAAHRELSLHVDADAERLAGLMAHADLAIGAGGGTSLERLCLGLPSIVVALVDNQRAQAAALVAAGAALAVAPASGGLGGQLNAALKALRGHEARQAMAQAAAPLCDGLGAARVVDAMALGLAPALWGNIA